MSNTPFEQGLAAAWELAGQALRGARVAERKAAESAFLETGLPTRKTEAWKYTDLEILKNQSFALRSPHPALSPEMQKILGGMVDPFEMTLIFVDGHLHLPGESKPLPRGVHLRDFEKIPEIPIVFGKRYQKTTDRFEPLNRSLATAAHGLWIDEGVVLEAPIHLIHLITPGQAPSMAHTQVRVHVEGGAKARFLVSHRTLPGSMSTFGTQATYFEVGAGAEVDILDTGRGHNRHVSMEHLSIHQHGGSRVSLTCLRRGSRLGRTHLEAVLEGEGARLDLKALSQLGGDMHQDFMARVRHATPRAESSSLFKGVLSDLSHGVFSGCVTVEEGAQGTQAAQAFRNLLLSEHARVDVRPELEILHDDVKCSHGATTGQLREDELFYLMSRGISREEARAMLARGFIHDLFGSLPEGRLRKMAEDFCAGDKPQ